MPLGEARSLLPAKTKRSLRVFGPAPVFQPADPLADRERLREITLEAQQYSPLVGLEEGETPESFWLDLSGSELLFGGEQQLARRIQSELAEQGILARIAVADTLGAAWAVSHFSSSSLAVVPTTQQKRALMELPVAALRVPDAVVDALKSLEVVTIGQVMVLPPVSLPSRFGKELLHRLDQALGQAAELMVAERLVEPIREEWLFEDPIVDRQILERVCDQLLERIVTVLGRRQAALRELTCHWIGTSESISLRLLRPTREHRYLSELLRLQSERIVLARGVTGVRMEVVETGIPALRQGLLFDDDVNERQQQSVAELVDRLSCRLGREAVLRSHLNPDPLPEYSCEDAPWLNDPASDCWCGDPLCLRSRPLKLLRIPRPLQVEQSAKSGLPTRINHSSVVECDGPERIESGWWRGADLKRDYYRLDLATGSRLWAFCDRNNGQWFLHGLFS